MTDAPQSRSSAPFPLAAIAVGLVVLLTVGLAGAQLLAGTKARAAAAWLERAESWRSLLLATAISIEGQTLVRAEGGYSVPWEEGKTVPFPITAADVGAEGQGMSTAYPLPIEDADAAASRLAESHEALHTGLLTTLELEPLAPIEALPPMLRTAAADVSEMMGPVTALLADETQTNALLRLAFAVIAIGAALLALGMFVRMRRAARERDRLQRHVTVLDGRTSS